MKDKDRQIQESIKQIFVDCICDYHNKYNTIGELTEAIEDQVQEQVKLILQEKEAEMVNKMLQSVEDAFSEGFDFEDRWYILVKRLEAMQKGEKEDE